MMTEEEVLLERIRRMTDDDVIEVISLITGVEDSERRERLAYEWATTALDRGLRTGICGGCQREPPPTSSEDDTFRSAPTDPAPR